MIYLQILAGLLAYLALFWPSQPPIGSQWQGIKQSYLRSTAAGTAPEFSPLHVATGKARDSHFHPNRFLPVLEPKLWCKDRRKMEFDK